MITSLKIHCGIANLIVIAFVLAIPIAAFAAERITPFSWKAKLSSSVFDANSNYVDDLLETNQFQKMSALDVIVALTECPSDDVIRELATFGDVEYIGRSLTLVHLQNVFPASLVNLAAMPQVSFVFNNDEVNTFLDVSGKSVTVYASSQYTPNTAQDAGYITNPERPPRIAVLDTGVDDGQHQFLKPAAAGFNVFTGLEINPDDDNGHGTHVAGIAMSVDATYSGTCRFCQLVDMKVLDSTGSGSMAGIIKALDKVIAHRLDWNIRVVNMSLGGSRDSDGTDPLSETVNRVTAEGVIVVAASGNDSARRIVAPAAGDGSITVAAVDDHNTVIRSDDNVATFSNFGPRLSDNDRVTDDEQKPDIAAPGVSILSAARDTTSGLATFSGTSQATPHVAGVVGLIVNKLPTIRPNSVKQILRAAYGTTWNPNLGFGEIDAFKAINFVDTVVTTDLSFAKSCGVTPFSPDLLPGSPDMVVGSPNTINAKVYNTGAQTSGGYTVKLGVYNFSNSHYSYDVCSIAEPALDAGKDRTTQCNWTPKFAGHSCLKAEIVYSNDTNYANNCAQHNVDIRTLSAAIVANKDIAPESKRAAFTGEFVNETEKKLIVRTKLSKSSANWDANVDHSNQQFTSYPGECPRKINVYLVPNDEKADAVSVDVIFEGRSPEDENWMDLGGFQVQAAIK
ncbi:S8 family serine peptidase [Rhizobium leguminosarum]|uniref:S8 family serine peptidase n=1 Tax=Rhizobium leguminosarum TaxID=384 RepID=UPI000B92BFD7|nr:S8 family serine peptidase [Rhizobium leguminosarum]ASS56435.1 hypothetical protein CHR56_18765 [Rhizobium leguminosarum bv. viciae]